jgi:hypothetical protein
VSAPILIEQQAISVSSGQTSFEAKFYNYATQNNEEYFMVMCFGGTNKK